MTARLVLPSLRLPKDAARLDDFLRLAERGVGGFCVFGGDASLPDLLARLQAAAPHPLLFAADLEHGAGQQIAGGAIHPPAAALDPDAAEIAGARTAFEARAHGLTMTFAPVCDVRSHPRNPIIQARAFRDPVACAPRFVAGAGAHGLRTCAKHFPGHGATDADSHDALPFVDGDAATWRARDLPPFAACIAAGVDAVMTAHLACPGLTGDDALPATLSRRVMTDLLRDEMGFTGLAVSDALCMDGVLQGRTEAEAAVAALAAGCDLVICPEDLDGVLAAVEGFDAGARLARVAAAAAPLPDALAAAAAASVEIAGPVPAPPGPHPLLICDFHGGGEALARAAAARGLGFRRIAPDGALLEERAGGGSAAPAVALLRRDQAWGAPLDAPGPVRRALEGAELLLVFGPACLAEGTAAATVVRAPGEDPATLAAALDRAFGPRTRL